MRREDLLKPDVVSEVILLSAATLIFAILLAVLLLVLFPSGAS